MKLKLNIISTCFVGMLLFSNCMIAGIDNEANEEQIIDLASNNFYKNSSIEIDPKDESSKISSDDFADMLASLEEFEAENPITDLPLQDKIKIAIEFLKIKAEEKKYALVGVGAGTLLCITCIYFAYKYHKNKTSKPEA